VRLGSDGIRQVRISAEKVGESRPLWIVEMPMPQSALSPGAHGIISNPAPTMPTGSTISLRSWRQRVGDRLSQFHQRFRQPRQQPSHGQARISAEYWQLSLFVIIGAFLAGGAVAAILNLSAFSHANPTNRPFAKAADPQPHPDPSQLQQQATGYLTQMIQAQQRFYQQHGRLANNLEELERSAAVMTQSLHYTYKLATEQRQSLLTATPRSERLQSYVGAVFLTPTATGIKPAIALGICASQQPSQTPPVLPQAMATGITCGSGSTLLK